MLPSTAELIALFESLSNWQDRYRQIIQLSKKLPNIPDELSITTNQIAGCENRVWLAYQQDEQGKLTFYGDSEGRIVKGLIAILIILANDKTAEQIEKTDFLTYFKQFNIIDGLSSSRQLGLSNIIKKINDIAQQNSNNK